MSAVGALVTGANRGIGLEVVRQLARAGVQVHLAAREPAAMAAAIGRLADEGLQVQPVVLDVASPESVAACAAVLSERGVRIDLLINNAGVISQGDVLASPPQAFVDALQVNALGALWCARAWMPGMLARGYGRIVCLSSGYGSFASGLGGPAAYSISKAALGAITVKLAQVAVGDVKVNAVDPGWVRTRMGGPSATRSVEAAAADVVWAARLPADGPSGCLLRRRRVVGW